MTKRTEDWPWYDVKAAVERAGKTLAAIADDNDLDRSTVTKVKAVPIPRIQSIIAAAIGEDPTTIWPTRYGDEGAPVPRHQWLKDNRARQRGHVQKRQAA